MTWLEALVEHGHAALTESLREPLWRRGVTDEQVALFRIGVLPGARLPDSLSPRFCAWWEGHRGKFRNPLVLPLTNTLGAVHGLQFRDIDPRVRGYLDYFETKEEPSFFGLAQAMETVWQREEVWLVEGAFDLCPLQRHVPNIVSTLHAGVSKQLGRLLKRVARKLVLAYDMDSTGLKVAYELARELKDTFEVAVVKFPRVHLVNGEKAKDPNDLWSAWGDARVGDYLRKVRSDINNEI